MITFPHCRKISGSICLLLFFAVLLLAVLSQVVFAAEITRWVSQSIYVSVYSHIYADERYKDKPFNLSVTLSIRNTDTENNLTLEKVNYLDSNGKLLKNYLKQPQNIAPLASTRYIVEEAESKGGSGAKFIVQWSSKQPIIEPIVESIMIGTKLQQGISFLSRGTVIEGKAANRE